MNSLLYQVDNTIIKYRLVNGLNNFFINIPVLILFLLDFGILCSIFKYI